jgi:biopolymer transport protein TolR|tara:strand:+ start:687 stop:1073 length:387 start_codon:yes stop_codon:yes gene_type:complete
MKKRRLMNQINVVPYIDVMLVLLVIFMVTAPMTNPGVVDLPRVGQSLKQQVAPIIISIKKDASIVIKGKKYKKDDLLAYVQNAISKNPEQSVVIAADKKVQYQEVVIVMDLLKQNEINKVGLLLKPEK